MSIDPLVAGAHRLWEHLAGVPVLFPPRGGVHVAVSPESRMCPEGWVGVVALCGSAIVTVPSDTVGAIVRDALRGLPVDAAVDAESVGRMLPVSRVLGPAALSYVSSERFRPVRPGVPAVEQLPAADPELRQLERVAGPDDADEAGLDEITSPAFVVRERGQVVAAAGYRTWPCGTAHVSVLTAPQARGRGLARVTGSATVAHALAAGLLPQWRARRPASRRVAAALGFAELGAQLSIEMAQHPALDREPPRA
ncbi:GNAT family N-acetyltransferase [Streptomyces sp. NPDC001492]